MAVPEAVTTKNLSGVYTLNKKLSDDPTPLMKMQGVGFLVRQAAAYSNIETTLKQYTDDEGKVHLDQHQVSTGGIKNDENRIIDWEDRDNDNRIWGKVRSKSRFVKVADIHDDDFLKQNWDQSTLEGEVIQSVNSSLTDTWTANQVYGFAEVEGIRRQVRRIVGKKGEEVHRIRMVYDWRSA